MEVVAENLLIHETLTFGSFVRLAVDVLGVRGLPDQIHYLKKHDDGLPWIHALDCDKETFDRVLVIFVYQDMAYRHWKYKFACDPRLSAYDLQTIEGQDTIRSFLLHVTDTAEYMTINPVLSEGQFKAVCVHRVSALL